MRKLRHGRSERLVEQDLLVCVGEVVLPSDHVRDAHRDIVDYYRQVVKRMTVGTKQHEILDLCVAALLRSINNVVESRLPLAWYFQTDGKRLACGGTTV